MKFAVFTVVVLALVFQTQSSVIPIGLGGIGLSVAGPLGHVVVPGGSVAIQSPVIQGLPSSVAVQVPNVVSVPGLPAAVTVAQSPVALPAPAVAVSAPVAVAAPAVVGVEGTYVAKTRGAVHVAPLAGHAQSAASVNLQPAPGTL
ncbi:adult cuticle protein 1-like [Eupeodes corollae]|uniref:adult cuticle protein 1-like n=1 Tax=Eupeodes corollae TaxID=290404 RepID=UPI00248FAC68|nr:adult cuticle protein 1-like [Eupeodes corollae]